MDRRSFLQTTGLTTVTALVARSTLAAAEGDASAEEVPSKGCPAAAT